MTSENETPQKKKKPYLHLLVSACITATFLYLTFREGESGEFWRIIEGVSVSGVTLYFALSLIGVFVRAWRYELLLRHTVRDKNIPSSYQIILITLVRNTLVDLLPARAGELGYIYFLNRAGVPVAQGASSFGFCVFLDLFVLMFIVCGFLLLGSLNPSFGTQNMSGGNLALAVLLVIACIAGMSVLLRYLPRLLRFGSALLHRVSETLGSKRLRSAAHWTEANVNDISEDFEKLAESRLLFRLCWNTFWLRALKYTSLYVLLLAVVAQWGLGSSDIHPMLSMVAFIVAEASASLPISGLMGFGAYESSWSLVLSLSHVTIPPATLLKVGLVVHLITQLKAYSLGFLAMLLLLLREFPRNYSTEAAVS